MSNLFYVVGGNFSGKTNWLKVHSNDGLYIGSEAVNFLSGIVNKVEDEILLHQKEENQELLKHFNEVFNFEKIWQTSPVKLSGGEAAILSIFTGLLLQKKKLNIDNTFEQLASEWRIKIFQFISTYFPDTQIFIADNRFKEYQVTAKPIYQITRRYNHSYTFLPYDFKLLSFSNNLTTIKELKLKNITFSYSKQSHIFKDLNLLFKSGVYHLKGVNGAGKSTLSKLVVGIEKPKNGSIIWNNQKITPYKYPGRYCTYTTQNPSDQISNDSVETEIIGASPYDQNKLQNILKAFGLANLVKVNPEELPFAIRKRINLASIIYDDKQIIIFDEPTLGQDDEFVGEFANLINKLRLSGKIIILISHSTYFISLIDNINVLELKKLS